MFKKTIDYSRNRKTYDSYSLEVEKLVSEGSRVLDVGCTTGKLARALKRKKCSVVGIDIDPEALKQAAKYSEFTVRADLDNLVDLRKKLKGEKFDVIVFSDVLEHLKYPGTILFELKKYLKLDGIIIAQIPNSGFIWLRTRFALGNFSYSKTGGLMDEEHLRFFSFKTAKVLFQDSGLKPNMVYGVSQVRRRYFFLRLLSKIWSTLFAIHIIIVASKK